MSATVILRAIALKNTIADGSIYLTSVYRLSATNSPGTRSNLMSIKLEIIEKLVRAEPLIQDLPTNIADWPEDWREVFEERAGIMEYDGYLSRDEAEQWAETIVRAAYKLEYLM